MVESFRPGPNGHHGDAGIAVQKQCPGQQQDQGREGLAPRLRQAGTALEYVLTRV